MNDPLPEYRVCVLSNRDTPDTDAADALAAATRALESLLAGARQVKATSSYVDYQQHYARCGSWPAWIRDVALGYHYGSSTPRYHALVVHQHVLGQANTAIVETALGGGKHVLFVNVAAAGKDAAAPAGALARVAAVEVLVPSSAQACARVVLS